MARKAARLERAGALTPRDRMWAAIRELGTHGGRFTAGDLELCPDFSAIEVQFAANARVAPEHQVHVDTVTTYLKDMAAAEPPFVKTLGAVGAVEGRKRSELFRWVLLRDVGVEAPRVTTGGKIVTAGAGRDAMWKAMKPLNEFDADELHAAARAGCETLSLSATIDYCKFLQRAGYLSIAVPAVPNKHRARYHFVRAMNTGPRAPVISKAKDHVVDGNTGRVINIDQGDRECKAKT